MKYSVLHKAELLIMSADEAEATAKGLAYCELIKQRCKKISFTLIDMEDYVHFGKSGNVLTYEVEIVVNAGNADEAFNRSDGITASLSRRYPRMDYTAPMSIERIQNGTNHK